MKRKTKRLFSLLMCLFMLLTTGLSNPLGVSAATTDKGSYVKGDNENNPIVTQNYGADPGVMVYKDTIYIYTTNDTQEFAGNNENTYGKINQLNCYSSTDMVNWTDHGSFNIAGSNGIAKWASNSWAPHLCYKTINGKDKFFLYFANSAGGIGVLTADSPTGPWKDPIGRALVTGRTAGCSGVVWMFDPAVLVDTDGTGYLYFGGGVPTGQNANPKTARVIKLGNDMTSTVGSAATIDAPYLFEDSGINKIGNTYFYSYCSNWNCANGFNNAAIEYMTSSSPMGPFTYKGEIMKNPGVFFPGSTGNNHHCIFEFKGSYYMAYHTRSVESKVIGKSLGYRTTQIDKISVSNGKINSLTPTMSGVAGSGNVNPYSNVQAETIFTQAGINVSGYQNGVAYVTNIHTGDYTKVKGVNFSKGMDKITVSVRSNGNGSIQVRDGSPSGALLGTINVSNTNGDFKWFSGAMKSVTGSKNICFVFSGSFDFDLWYASNGSSSEGGNNGGNNGGNTGNNGGNTGESGSQSGQVVEPTLLNTYGKTYGYSGTCINLSQLRNASDLAFLKKHYNSITLENEMKPDALLGNSPSLMTVAQAKSQGYYIPDNYKESYVPKINFSTVDTVLQICADNGLKMRGHTLVWHSQSPQWFFKNGYNGGSSFVSPSTMDARMEMYIKTVMNHVYSGKNGSVMYAWDVCNEIPHANDQNWIAVYGRPGNKPEYARKAFKYACETLDYYKLRGQVKLFYNDYNTYMEVNDLIASVNYINANEKLCDGIGMQSHLGTSFPSVDYYTTALKSFLNAGFEVQITEMDITNKGDSDMATYAYNLYKNINALKKSGGKISGITWWGLSDRTTWIDNSAPLLFSAPGTPKQAYNKVIQAYTETFGQPTTGGSTGGSTGGGSTGGSTGGGSEATATAGQKVTVADGWYYLKNVNAQKYLQVANNEGKANANVELGTGTGAAGQKWYITNTSDGYITLTSGLGNFMLDVANDKNEDGTNIGIYNAYSGNAQKFQVQTSRASGVYMLATKTSDLTKAVDAYNFGKEDGTNICQWAKYGAENQQFVFEKTTAPSNGQGSSDNGNNNDNSESTTVVPGNTAKLADGWYYIKNTNAQKYMTVAGNTGANGQNVELANGTGAAGQKWYLKNLGDGYITLTSGLGDFMLDVTGAKNVDNTNMEIYRNHGGTAEQFMLKPAVRTSGAYFIATKASGLTKVVEVYNHSKLSGANICQYSYFGNENQEWVFEPVKASENTETPEDKPSEDPKPTEPEKTGLDAAYTINSWGSGYQVNFKITNKGAQVNTWTLKLKKSELTITSSWNVNIETSGDYYVITPVSWNSTIANGGSVEFGVQGSGTIGNSISCTVQ